MAIKNKEHSYEKTIHHSDRGIQYCFPEYTEFATNIHEMVLSTTEKYDPYENAVAERINQTLKYEFGLIKTIPSIEIANKMLQQVGGHVYNNQRRHRSIEMRTPSLCSYAYQTSHLQILQNARLPGMLIRLKKSLKRFFTSLSMFRGNFNKQTNFYNKKWSTYFRARHKRFT